MKKTTWVVAFATLLACSNKEEAYNKESEFYVRGNCEMCKARIEDAAQSTEGVVSAVWNINSNNLLVKYDSTKTNELALHQIIASTGHGTKMVEMDHKAHSQLPSCCQVGKKH